MTEKSPATKMTISAGFTLVVFTVISSQAYLRWLGIADDYDFPYYQWWTAAWNCFIGLDPSINPHELGYTALAGIAIPGGMIVMHALRQYNLTGQGPAWMLAIAGRGSIRNPYWRPRMDQRSSTPMSMPQPSIVGASANYGTADFATDQEMRARWPAPATGKPCMAIAELYDPRLVKGPYNPRIPASWGPGGRAPLLFDDLSTGSGHSCRIAGSGGGKTQALLLTLRHYWTGPVVVLDPKQNLAQQLKIDRERMGHTVRILGQDCGFNALGWITPNTLDTDPNIDRTVEWACGETPERIGSDNTAFFSGAAKDVARGIESHMFSDKTMDASIRTYRAMRALISQPEEQFREYIQAIYNTTNSQRARECLAPICSKDNDTLRSIQYTAQRLTAWLSTEKWENMVCGNAFEAADITNSLTDVFIPISFQDLSAEPAVARCILGALFNAGFEAQGRGRFPILFALDEIAELKEFAPIRTTLRQGREFNMFLHLMYQSYADVIKQWGQNGMIELLENCTWVSWAGIKDYTVAEDISKRIGEYPVVAVSESTNTSRAGRPMEMTSRSRGSTVTISEMGRRRIKPEEIIGLREDAQLISARGIPPVITGLPADHQRRSAERMAA